MGKHRMRAFLKSTAFWKTLIGVCLSGLFYATTQSFNMSILFSSFYGFGVHRAFLMYLIFGGVIGFGWHMLTRNKR